jgi:uracil-DNA glycosylase
MKGLSFKGCHFLMKNDRRQKQMPILNNHWQNELETEFSKPYYQKLSAFLANEYKTETIYPNADDIFNALNFTDYPDVKAVILGQDPYHGEGQAHGLSFSVKPGIQLPPSLQNIFKEMTDDLGAPMPSHGYLKQWADEGVLLLNTVLTVRAGQANSHQKKGWETFTDAVIDCLSKREDPVVFILWGNNARSKQNRIASHHMIIESPHPSPLSSYRGFFGSKPFSKTNAYLESIGKKPINWTLEELVSSK